MKQEIQQFRQYDDDAIRALLVGRRIVKAEEAEYPALDRYGTKPTGRLTLDNGTEIYIVPNQGGCGCSAGDYVLEKLATVDNAISDVSLEEDVLSEHYGEEQKRYRIHVVADAIEMDVITIEGDDGNGYYGTGYELFVVAPENDAR